MPRWILGAIALVVVGASACVRGVRDDDVVSVTAVAAPSGTRATQHDPVVAVGSVLALRFEMVGRLGDGSLAGGPLVPTAVRSLDPRRARAGRDAAVGWARHRSIRAGARTSRRARAVDGPSFGADCAASAFGVPALHHALHHGRAEGLAEPYSYLVIRARTVDGRVVASLDGQSSIRSDTPAVCTVRPTTRAYDVVGLLQFHQPESIGYQPNALEIVGTAPGTCEITALAGSASTHEQIVVW
jgi:hypothetical protein